MKRRFNLHGATLADALKDSGNLYPILVRTDDPKLDAGTAENQGHNSYKGNSSEHTTLWVSISGPICKTI
jgi:hypothetical protein